MLTQPDFNLTFLFRPCGFLSLPCSASSLGFMSYMLIILPGLGSSIIWAPEGRWNWLSSSLHTPQPPAVWRNRLVGRAGPAGKRKGGFTWWSRKGNGMPIPLHHPGSGFPLSTQLFLKTKGSSQSPVWGWGAPENSISVSKLSGTCLSHHRVWVTAKDPTVIQVSFFPAKWVYSDE